MMFKWFDKLSAAIAAGPLGAAGIIKPDLAAGRIYETNLPRTEVIRLFSERAVASGSVAHTPGSIDELGRIVRETLPAGSSILIDPTLDAAGELTEKLHDGFRVLPMTGFDDEILFTVTAAITAVDLAVAETGSIVLSSRPSQPRLASLTPEFHFALIRPDQIVPVHLDLPERLKKLYGSNTPKGITIISGPSKTADIEMNLVIGVHGPAQMHMVILPD